MAPLAFKTAFKYPFNRAKGLLNILWLLLPIFGWFALGGYIIRIVQEFSQGKFAELPTFSFGSDMKLGFFMFLKAIPFFLVWMVISEVLLMGMLGPLGELLSFLIEVLVLPILALNFINRMTVGSFFDFEKVGFVFNHLGDYLLAFVKDILLWVVYFVLSIVLVGIPAMAFTHHIFLADFYGRHVLKRKAQKKRK